MTSLGFSLCIISLALFTLAQVAGSWKLDASNEDNSLEVDAPSHRNPTRARKHVKASHLDHIRKRYQNTENLKDDYRKIRKHGKAASSKLDLSSGENEASVDTHHNSSNGNGTHGNAFLKLKVLIPVVCAGVVVIGLAVFGVVVAAVCVRRSLARRRAAAAGDSEQGKLLSDQEGEGSVDAEDGKASGSGTPGAHGSPAEDNALTAGMQENLLKTVRPGTKESAPKMQQAGADNDELLVDPEDLLGEPKPLPEDESQPEQESQPEAESQPQSESQPESESQKAEHQPEPENQENPTE